MKNYICINGNKTELTAEQVAQFLRTSPTPVKTHKLSEYAPGETVKLGTHEMVVLEQTGDTTFLICKNPLPRAIKFGSSNNYNGSYVDEACNEFAEEITAIVGAENLLFHTVDLTTDDGLKDYGTCKRRAFLLTADEYRRYVEILDKHKVDRRYWLATALTTKRHGDDHCVKCVAPSGYINNRGYDNGRGGSVRPACILKSDIFVFD